MSVWPILTSFSGALATAMVAMAPAAAASDPLARYQWKSRVLVIVAPNPSHPGVLRQRDIIAQKGNGAEERDLVIVEAVDASAGAKTLRQRFGVPETEFRVVLVGKDGGEKLASPEPISAERLFGEIDAMPMRRQEMRR